MGDKRKQSHGSEGFRKLLAGSSGSYGQRWPTRTTPDPTVSDLFRRHTSRTQSPTNRLSWGHQQSDYSQSLPFIDRPDPSLRHRSGQTSYTRQSSVSNTRRPYSRSLSLTNAQQTDPNTQRSDHLGVPQPPPPPPDPALQMPPPPAPPAPVPQVIPGLDNTDMALLQTTFVFPATRYLLGRGNWGSVYRAQNRHTGQRVAIKVCKGGSPSDVGKYQRESTICTTLMQMPHANIMAIVSTQFANQRLYLVSELSPLGDLKQYMTRANRRGVRVWHAMREPMARHLFPHICKGMAHLHSIPIAFGDLKPENVLLFPDPQAPAPDSDLLPTSNRFRCDRFVAKLTDFGNASVRKPRMDPPNMVYQNVPLGTAYYSAPEVYRPPIKLGNILVYDCLSADRYSLGTCLWAMVIGANPFSPGPRILAAYNNNQDKFKQYILKMKRDEGYIQMSLRPLPVQLRGLISRLITTDYNTRPTIDEVLADDWLQRPLIMDTNTITRRRLNPYQTPGGSLEPYF